MTKNHLKRLAAPKHWTIARKENTFVTRPKPGRGFDLAMPLSHVMKELLKKGKTTKEVRYILYSQPVLINGKRTYDHRRPTGFMDVISFPEIKEHYRITLGITGRLTAVKADHEDVRIVKIMNKTRTTQGTQINCQDGTNITVSKDTYNTGDSLLIKKGKVDKHLALTKGATIMLTGGRHLAKTGTVKEVDGRTIYFTTTDGDYSTARKYAYVVGTDKPEVTTQ